MTCLLSEQDFKINIRIFQPYWLNSSLLPMWVNDPCPCVQTYPRLPKGIYGRADDLFVVRGENVYPSAFEDVVREIKGFGDEYRIIITREKTMDELIVQDNLDYKGVKIPLSI